MQTRPPIFPPPWLTSAAPAFEKAALLDVGHWPIAGAIVARTVSRTNVCFQEIVLKKSAIAAHVVC